MASLQEALTNLLRSKKAQSPKQEKTIEEEREVARQMSKMLPEPMFPHQALRKKKKQLADLDEQAQE